LEDHRDQTYKQPVAAHARHHANNHHAPATGSFPRRLPR
jgi:hypothetical protein